MNRKIRFPIPPQLIEKNYLSYSDQTLAHELAFNHIRFIELTVPDRSMPYEEVALIIWHQLIDALIEGEKYSGKGVPYLMYVLGRKLLEVK